MSERDHITADQYSEFLSGEMPAEAASAISEHLAACPDCRHKAESLERFVGSLNDEWNARRLESLGFAHPSEADLDAVWMEEASPEVIRVVQNHLEDCEDCTKHMKRLNEGYSALSEANPLAGPQWSKAVSRRFAAGIEVVVEAVTGAFTSAAGMVREVMMPQSTAWLAATPVVAMGRKPVNPSSVVWHDATFQTDDVSGELTGSADTSTGRGIVTLVVYKSGAYMGGAPMVDLIDSAGTVVATQAALDMGDRYSASFSGLDEGHYLVGIREPGG